MKLFQNIFKGFKVLSIGRILTSEESLSWNILFNMCFYSVKLGAYFFFLFVDIIPDESIRIFGSLFFGISSAKAILSINNNMPEKSEFSIWILAIIDLLILMVVVNVFSFESYVELINKLIFCFYVEILSFCLIYVFVFKERKRRKKQDLNSQIADLEKVKGGLEETKANLEKTKANLEQTVSNLEYEVLTIEKDIEDRYCEYCNEKLPSKKSRDAHRPSCRLKHGDMTWEQRQENESDL